LPFSDCGEIRFLLGLLRGYEKEILFSSSMNLAVVSFAPGLCGPELIKKKRFNPHSEVIRMRLLVLHDPQCGSISHYSLDNFHHLKTPTRGVICRGPPDRVSSFLSG